MSNTQKKVEHIVDVPIGLLRIYFRRGSKLKQKGFWKRLNSIPDYAAIIRAAKVRNVPIAKVKNSQMGYMDGDKVQIEGAEIANPLLPVYVELIGSREVLTAFCEAEWELLHGKQMFFSELHRWDLV